MFADDSLIFCGATKEEAQTVKSILHDFEEASSQKINLAKSNVLFGKGIPLQRRDEILMTLDIREVLSYNKYLGFPCRISKSKKKAFMPLKDRVYKSINGWMGKNLSWAGREVLVKAVAQAVPTYAMSVFKLPGDFTQSVQSSILNYWWGHDDTKRKIH